MRALLKIHRFYDSGDVFGVNKLYGLSRDLLLLQKCPVELVDDLLNILKFSTDSNHEYSACLIELFNTVKDDSENMETNKRFSLSFNETETGISPQYQNAVMIKGLKILGCILASDIRQIKEWFNVEEIMASIIWPYLENSVPIETRIEALHCLGILAIAYDDVAVSNIRGITELIFKSTQPIRSLSLQIFMDLLYYWKPQKFSDLDITQLLINCLNTRKDDLLSLAVEGIVKLLISKRVNSVELVENLLILYFHPRTTTLPRVRQCLAYLFSGWTKGEPGNVRILSDLLLQVLLKLFQIHSQNSDLNMLDPADIAAQIIDWIDPRKAFESEDQFDFGYQCDIVQNLLRNMFSYTQLQLRYSSAILSKFYIEKAGNERLAANLLYLELLMENISDSSVFTTLKRYKTSTAKLVFKSYKLPADLEDKIRRDVNQLITGDNKVLEFGTPSKSILE
eukprot:NODE_586_length_5672_cov_0.462229.p1 type:complete len:453 gc:universal NODE_586_length_5672_cov_0.462229:3363-4721(+)